MDLGTKWVAVAHHGLILWESGATGSKIIFKIGPGAQNCLKYIQISTLTKFHDYFLYIVFSRIFLYTLFGVTAGVIFLLLRRGGDGLVDCSSSCAR